MSRPLDADQPIWFTTKNRNRYHKQSAVNSSACSSDGKPTAVKCGPIPRGGTVCATCVARSPVTVTEPVAPASSPIVAAAQSFRTLIEAEAAAVGPTPIEELSVDAEGRPTAIAPFNFLLGLSAGQLFSYLGQAAREIVISGEGHEDPYVNSWRELFLHAWRRLRDFGVDEEKIQASVQALADAMAGPFGVAVGVPQVSAPAMTATCYCIEQVMPGPEVVAAKLEAMKTAGEKDAVIPLQARVIALPGPEVSDVLASIETAHAWAKQQYPLAEEISCEEMARRTALSDDELAAESDAELEALDAELGN
jgi:hypothetical protein